MIKLLGQLPKKLTVALSGGVDSIAAVDFLSRKHEVSAAFFNHGTEQCNAAQGFVTDFCNTKNIQLTIGAISAPRGRKTSIEEHWRNERYQFLDSLDTVVVTAHTLDDCVETYLYGSLHGQPKVIPYRRNRVIRPFLATTKTDLTMWCTKRGIEWYEDTSNLDLKHMRNYIRHELLPCALKVNPGLSKVVKRIVENRQMIEANLVDF